MQRAITVATAKPCKRGHLGGRYKSGGCRECRLEWMKARLLDETEEHRRARLAKMREATSRWYQENKQRHAAKGRAWKEANRDKQADYHRKWCLQFKEKLSEKSREYYRNNKGKVLARTRVAQAARRALGTISTKQISDMFEKQRGLCMACRRKLNAQSFHLDHVVAIKNGGTNDAKNLQLLCQSCNLRKAAKSMEQFMKELGQLL